MEGYIKLHRQSQENEMYFNEAFTKRQAWQDLLITTNWKDGKLWVRGNMVEVKRGQNGYSEDTLAGRRKWSRGKVRRFLNYLETIQQIVQQKSTVKSIITIVNREKYQGNGTTDSTTDGHQTVQQTDTIKKENNDKKEKEINTASPIILNAEEKKTTTKNKYTPEFEMLRKEYPHVRTGHKKDTFDSRNKLTATDDEIMQEIKLYVREIATGVVEKTYICGMSVRMNSFVITQPYMLREKLKAIAFKIFGKEGKDRHELASKFAVDYGIDMLNELKKEHSLINNKKPKFIWTKGD